MTDSARRVSLGIRPKISLAHCFRRSRKKPHDKPYGTQTYERQEAFSDMHVIPPLLPKYMPPKRQLWRFFTYLLAISLGFAQLASAAYAPSGLPVFANNGTGIVTYASAVSVNDLEIVGGLLYPESGPITPTATDSLGNTCTLYSNQYNATEGGGAAWFYCPVTHAGTPTITIAASGVTTYEIQLSDYNGFTGTPTAVMADNVSANNGGSATPAAGPFNSSDNNELMIGATWANDAAYMTLPSGWTLNHADTAYTNSFYLTQATSGTATSISGTLSSSSAWFASIQGFIGSSASCVNYGYTSAGAIIIPTASSTSVWLKGGTFGTVDCSTTNFWQPKLGVFGAN